MTRLLARIMLALLMLPCASMLYVVVAVVAMKLSPSGYRDGDDVFLAGGICGAAFVATYWILLWRSTVRWTPKRLGWTVLSGAGALVPGAISGAAASFVDSSFGIFVGGVVSILSWVVATVFIWQETRDERADRLRGAGHNVISCPTCGYNLTGLRQTVCPECGATFTLDQLLAAQPSRESSELEQT